MKDEDVLKMVHSNNTDLSIIKSKFEALEKMLSTLITRPEFDPVKMIAYGMAGSVLLTVLGALLARVIAK